MTDKLLNQIEIDREIKNSLISQINKIVNQGHKLIIVYPVPEIEFDVPKTLLKKYFIEKDKFDQNLIPVLTTNFDLFKKRNKYVFEILDKIKSPNIFKVYPHKYFCNTLIDNRCVTNDTKNFFYRDSNHLSLKGSEFVVNEIIQIINSIN